ncbi:MAG: c-type cytochrome [Terriglobales bacterium]
MRMVQCCGLLLLMLMVAASAAAQDMTPVDYFRQNCMSCHTIGGGRLTGPDLKDVTQRKDPAWLTKFMSNPSAMIASGDPYALKLRDEAGGVVMPTLPGMTPQRAQQLLDFITAESKPPRSQFAGSQVSDRPFTARDVAIGRALFRGEQRLSGGGPACISCHTMKRIGALGGGRLGPDLTLVYERLQGRKGLSAWLMNPASPTMAPVFRAKAMQPEEILPLVALFEDAALKGGQDDTTALLNFLLLGAGGMVLGLVLLDAVWKKRLRGVRRFLVHRDRGEQ